MLTVLTDQKIGIEPTVYRLTQLSERTPPSPYTLGATAADSGRSGRDLERGISSDLVMIRTMEKEQPSP